MWPLSFLQLQAYTYDLGNRRCEMLRDSTSSLCDTLLHTFFPTDIISDADRVQTYLFLTQ